MRWIQGRFVVTCLALATAIASVRSVAKAVDETRVLAVSPNAEVEARLATLRPYVPRGQRLGYVAPRDQGETRYWLGQMLAQYVLAPSYVEASETELVVADFESDLALDGYVARVGGTIVARPVAGLAIVRRSVPSLR